MSCSQISLSSSGWSPVHVAHKFEGKNPDDDESLSGGNHCQTQSYFFLDAFEEHYVMCIFTCSHQCSLVSDFRKLFVPVLPLSLVLVLKPPICSWDQVWIYKNTIGFSHFAKKNEKVWFKTMSITLHITKQFFLCNSAQLKLEIE
jgi:hypothetical protein